MPMAWYWLWVVIVGAVVLIGGAVGGRILRGPEPAEPGPSLAAVALGILLAGIAFVLCAPSAFPFSRGLGLGYGVLLGAGAAVLAVAGVRVARPAAAFAPQAAALCSAGGAALVWVGVTEIAFHGDPTYALLGGAAGSILVLLPILWASPAAERGPLGLFALAVLVLGLGALLSIGRYHSTGVRPYWALPSVVFGGGLLGTLVGALVLGHMPRSQWLTGLLTAALAIGSWFGIAHLLARSPHFTPERPVAYLIALGLAAFALVCAIAPAGRERLFGSVAVPVLGIAALIIGFNLAGGYGAGFAVAAGLPLSISFWARERASGRMEAAFWLAALAALYLAYRVYLTWYARDLRSPDTLEFARHYTLVGLAVGILWTAAGAHERRSTGAALAALAGLVVAPFVLYIVFGYEALVGLILGLLVGQLALPAFPIRQWSPVGIPATFFPLAAVWALIIPRWSSFLLDEPRWIRALVIGVSAALGLVVLALLRRQPAETVQE